MSLSISSLLYRQRAAWVLDSLRQSLPRKSCLSTRRLCSILARGAIYTTLIFRCNGTLESLTIPSQVRDSDYTRVDDYLEPRPSIWRFNADSYKLISENDQRQRVSGVPRELKNGEVLSFTFTVMLQMDIQAGDVLGFRLLGLGDDGRIEHLPLLYKPGPTPGSFTPIVIADFNPTSDIPPTEPSDVPSPSSQPDSEFKSVAK